MSAEIIKFTNLNGHELAAKIELPDSGFMIGYALFAHCFTCNKNLIAVRNIGKELTNLGC